MNFTKSQVNTIRHLADTRKLQVKIYKYKGILSVELHENTSYSLADQFNLIIADNVKTLKECKQIAANFLNWLDQYSSYGYNIRTKYVDL
ncbi:hypothetical protein [Robertmurraya siralis]|uniref:hypothetical protein n=1 Tax=Robertmurraya siralis TaxID=77777 RepID=UPI0010F500F9|nr:hypothetical protein [Robertmurraya siralis]